MVSACTTTTTCASTKKGGGGGSKKGGAFKQSATASKRRWESINAERGCHVEDAVVLRHGGLEVLVFREHLEQWRRGGCEGEWRDAIAAPYAFRKHGIRHGDKASVAELETATAKSGFEECMTHILQRGSYSKSRHSDDSAAVTPKTTICTSKFESKGEKTARRAKHARSKLMAQLATPVSEDKENELSRKMQFVERLESAAAQMQWRDNRQKDKWGSTKDKDVKRQRSRKQKAALIVS